MSDRPITFRFDCPACHNGTIVVAWPNDPARHTDTSTVDPCDECDALWCAHPDGGDNLKLVRASFTDDWPKHPRGAALSGRHDR